MADNNPALDVSRYADPESRERLRAIALPEKPNFDLYFARGEDPRSRAIGAVSWKASMAATRAVRVLDIERREQDLSRIRYRTEAGLWTSGHLRAGTISEGDVMVYVAMEICDWRGAAAILTRGADWFGTRNGQVILSARQIKAVGQAARDVGITEEIVAPKVDRALEARSRRPPMPYSKT